MVDDERRLGWASGRPTRRRGGRHRRCDTASRFRPEAWRALVGGLGLVALVILSSVVPQGAAGTASSAALVPAAVETTATSDGPHDDVVGPRQHDEGARDDARPGASEKKVCDKFGSTPVQGGRYEVQNDLWGAGSSQCVIAFDTGFRVEANHNKSSGPASYPSIVFGCNYGNCTKGTPFPRPISDLGDLRTSWTTTTPDKGDYNVAYDIWLDPTARKEGAPTGLELMIWLKHTDRVNPIGKQTGETTLDGVPYEVWQGSNGVPVDLLRAQAADERRGEPVDPDLRRRRAEARRRQAELVHDERAGRVRAVDRRHRAGHDELLGHPERPVGAASVLEVVIHGVHQRRLLEGLHPAPVALGRAAGAALALRDRARRCPSGGGGGVWST